MKAKILVILPTSNFLHRQILEGILEYSKSDGPWQFHLVTGDDFEQGPDFFRFARRQMAPLVPCRTLAVASCGLKSYACSTKLPKTPL